MQPWWSIMHKQVHVVVRPIRGLRQWISVARKRDKKSVFSNRKSFSDLKNYF